MKNQLKIAILVTFMTMVQMSQSNAVAGNLKVNKPVELNAAEAQKLVSRLEEIKAMDKESMTKSEKRALRKEVKATNARLSTSVGVYLSVGAVIIIILLLILLL